MSDNRQSTNHRLATHGKLTLKDRATGRNGRLILFAVGLLVCYSLSWAQADTTFKPNWLPKLEVPLMHGDITIDGDMQDSGWKGAAVADNFAEHSPGDQTRPPVQTKVLVTYDESNLYLAFIAYDDPTTVRYSYRDRDEIFRDDYIGLLLDTYNDASWAYEIFVNPLGVQGDLRMLSNGDEDASFDMVFDSKGQVTDSGYQVEVAIPFASLRFPDKPEQVWRVNFWRDHQRELRRRYNWAASDRNNPCWMCQWGYLTGMKNIHAGKDLEVMPTLVGFQSGTVNDNLRFKNDNPDVQASGNVRYGLSSNSSIEATINPDFSQVESDAGQVDVNTTFGLFYSETRPFFQEGGELFNTYIDAVYTRSINDPNAAAKFTGQFKRISIAYLAAQDAHSPVTIPLRQQSIFGQGEKSTINILRVRQSFLENSFLGFTLTDRRMQDAPGSGIEKGGSGTVAGLDGRVRFMKNYKLAFQALLSHTDEITAPDMIDTTVATGRAQATFDYGKHTVALDGEKYSGNAVKWIFERSARLWSFDVVYTANSPGFRADNGFVVRNDFQTMEASTNLDFRPNREWLISWTPSIDVGRSWIHNGTMNLWRFTDDAYDEWVTPSLYFSLKGQTEVYLKYVASQERFFGKLFPGISRGTFQIDSRFSELLSGGFSYTEGRTIWRDRVNPELGYGHDFNIYANIKPTRRLFIQPNFTYSRLDYRDAYIKDHPGTAKNIFDGYIFRTRATYQFTREWFLRLVIQYDDFGKQFDVEPLLTYKINPFTKFYIGMNSSYHSFYRDDYPSLPTNSEWKLNSRQFFAKLQYLFRM
jgi:hypothetical protein